MKTIKIRLAALLIAGSTFCTALAGCSMMTESAQTNQSTTSGTIQANNSPTLLQIEYYEGIISDLETRLLNEKEANYIAAGTYKQKIAELEAIIDSLNKKIDILSKNDIQGSDTPEFKEQVAITPSINNNQSSTEFIYNGNTITQYKGNKSTVHIPESINGVMVTHIGDGAFENSEVEKVILSDKIEYIDWFAFSGCTSLSEIYIPDSVTSIGYGAFDNCSSFLIIKCPKNSYAEAYAKSWGIIVITE